jgi:hypothetical protein
MLHHCMTIDHLASQPGYCLMIGCFHSDRNWLTIVIVKAKGRDRRTESGVQKLVALC